MYSSCTGASEDGRGSKQGRFLKEVQGPPRLWTRPGRVPIPIGVVFEMPIQVHKRNIFFANYIGSISSFSAELLIVNCHEYYH